MGATNRKIPYFGKIYFVYRLTCCKISWPIKPSPRLLQSIHPQTLKPKKRHWGINFPMRAWELNIWTFFSPLNFFSDLFLNFFSELFVWTFFLYFFSEVFFWTSFLNYFPNFFLNFFLYLFLSFFLIYVWQCHIDTLFWEVLLKFYLHFLGFFWTFCWDSGLFSCFFLYWHLPNSYWYIEPNNFFSKSFLSIVFLRFAWCNRYFQGYDRNYWYIRCWSIFQV